MNRNGTKWLVAAMAMALVIGFAATGALAAVNSGATDFSIVAFPTTTTVGQDPVNFTIQVLDKDGNINLMSNGQVGDVLFQITTALGTAISPANAAIGGSVGPGVYNALSSPNVRPNVGLLTGSINYAGASGTDTITIAMFESVASPSIFGDVVCGAMIGKPKTINIKVNQGSAITRINNVTLVNAIIANAATEITAAGAATTIQVQTPAGQNGLVNVSFVGINAPDADGNNANGTTVNVDVQVANGFGQVITTEFKKAGFYEVRAAAANGITYTKQQALVGTNIFGQAFRVQVRPSKATNCTLAVNKNVVAVAIAGDPRSNQAQLRIVRLDQFGNATSWDDPVAGTPAAARAITIVPSVNGVLGMPAVAQFAAGASVADDGTAIPPVVTGVGVGTCTILARPAAAAGISDSNSVTIVSAANDIITAEVDDGTGAVAGGGLLQRAVGSTLRLINITGPALADGQAVSLKLGNISIPSSLQAMAGGFSASFVLPTAAIRNPVNLVLELQNGALGSVMAFQNVVGLPLYTLTTHGVVGKTVQLINPNGFPVTNINLPAAGGVGPWTIPSTTLAVADDGGHFQVLDQYGNNVTYARGQLIGTLSSTGLTAGNNTTVGLGTDAAANVVAPVVADRNLTWGATATGAQTVTLTPIATSGIAPITFSVNIQGNAQMKSIVITPAATKVLANSTIPIIVETLDANGRRIASANNSLIISLQSTGSVANLTDCNGIPVNNGTLIDTAYGAGSYGAGSGSVAINGRISFALNTGNVKDKLKIRVQNLNGSIVGESPEIEISYNQPPQIGINPGETKVSIGLDEKVELMVNSTNTYGDNPSKAYLVFTATLNGKNTPIYLLTTDGRFVDAAVANLDTDTFTFSATGVTTLGITTLNDLLGGAMKSGDVLAYAYAYFKTNGDLVMDNKVFITAK